MQSKSQQSHAQSVPTNKEKRHTRCTHSRATTMTPPGHAYRSPASECMLYVCISVAILLLRISSLLRNVTLRCTGARCLYRMSSLEEACRDILPRPPTTQATTATANTARAMSARAARGAARSFVVPDGGWPISTAASLHRSRPRFHLVLLADTDTDTDTGRHAPHHQSSITNNNSSSSTATHETRPGGVRPYE